MTNTFVKYFDWLRFRKFLSILCKKWTLWCVKILVVCNIGIIKMYGFYGIFIRKSLKYWRWNLHLPFKSLCKANLQNPDSRVFYYLVLLFFCNSSSCCTLLFKILNTCGRGTRKKLLIYLNFSPDLRLFQNIRLYKLYNILYKLLSLTFLYFLFWGKCLKEWPATAHTETCLRLIEILW